MHGCGGDELVGGGDELVVMSKEGTMSKRGTVTDCDDGDESNNKNIIIYNIKCSTIVNLLGLLGLSEEFPVISVRSPN